MKKHSDLVSKESKAVRMLKEQHAQCSLVFIQLAFNYRQEKLRMLLQTALERQLNAFSSL